MPFNFTRFNFLEFVDVVDVDVDVDVDVVIVVLRHLFRYLQTAFKARLD